ncbi:DUF389 domain-containing protein [Methanocella sp. MCL-LM]|uniref:DUF389 domain-containing protein n=1 Tax=Methanocella sp. MCL-LM TaxID=3412035 RepID=UPI003C725E41
MRRLEIWIPSGKGKEIVDMAKRHGGLNISLVRSEPPAGPGDLVSASLPNDRIEGFVGEAGKISEVRLTLMPTGVVPMYPPEDHIEEQATDVSSLSPIEVYLYGLMSIGSWKSFIGYSVAAGAIVWVGLFTNTIYLLIAAMLIAPFAGPAMNTAIATARGDVLLLRRSLLRYCVSLLIAMVVAGIMSFAMGQETATNMMISVSKLSSVFLLLPVVAGAAGALNQTQSEHNSLVSGAAVGLLVAASLAPQAGLIGMAAVIGRWDLVDNGLFALLGTIFGINLGGCLVFRAFGLSSQGARYPRGRKWISYLTIALTSLAIVGILGWQFYDPPELQKSTKEQRASTAIQEVVDNSGMATFLEANVRYAPASTPDRNLLLADVHVMRAGGITLPSDELKRQLTDMIDGRLMDKSFDAIPLVNVIVIDKPEEKS